MQLKNIFRIMIAGSFVGLGLSSCVSEELSAEDARKGSMSLTVDKLEPSATRAVETADFPVAIFSLSDNQEYASYEKVSLVPKQIKMPVGMYYAEAHTPGEFLKYMTAPYYAGREEFEILQATNTHTKVTCRMANGSITVRFSDEFLTAFSDWTITIDDGAESALVYTREKDGTEPETTYMRFEENNDVLNVNFKGKTQNGNSINASNKLTKKAADEQYDSDDTNFSGGDLIVIYFNPVEGTDGDITGITLNADIAFDDNETEGDFEIGVEDNTEEEGGEDTPGEGGGDSDAITLKLPADMIASATTDPSLGDTYIASENGLKSIVVKVSTTSDEMVSSLQDLYDNYGVNFLGGTEVVGNKKMVELFSELGQPLAVPAEGDTEYTFPIGNFFTLLAFLPGEHTFTLTITDMEGNTKDGILKLTVE
jgi:hypothetical protein